MGEENGFGKFFVFENDRQFADAIVGFFYGDLRLAALFLAFYVEIDDAFVVAVAIGEFLVNEGFIADRKANLFPLGKGYARGQVSFVAGRSAFRNGFRLGIDITVGEFCVRDDQPVGFECDVGLLDIYGGKPFSYQIMSDQPDVAALFERAGYNDFIARDPVGSGIVAFRVFYAGSGSGVPFFPDSLGCKETLL